MEEYSHLAVYEELTQFSVNYFLLRGAEEEKAMYREMIQNEREWVILTTIHVPPTPIIHYAAPDNL